LVPVVLDIEAEIPPKSNGFGEVVPPLLTSISFLNASNSVNSFWAIGENGSTAASEAEGLAFQVPFEAIGDHGSFSDKGSKNEDVI